MDLSKSAHKDEYRTRNASGVHSEKNVGPASSSSSGISSKWSNWRSWFSSYSPRSLLSRQEVLSVTPSSSPVNNSSSVVSMAKSNSHPHPHHPHHHQRLTHHGLAGAGAAVISAFITCPLDVIRTVIQVQRKVPGQFVKYSGTVNTFKTILSEEGIRGCYKGLGTTLIALIPNWGLYFYVYNRIKEKAVSSGFDDGPKTQVMAAAGACVTTDLLVTPLWMIKTRLQTSFLDRNPSRSFQTQRMNLASATPAPVKYRSTWHAFRTILREEGFTALFKGLTPQLLGVVHAAVQFPLYEYLKKKLAERGSKTTGELNFSELMGSSAIAKVTASVIAYPHEVLRSRFQYQHNSDPNRYKSIADAVSRIYREEGWRGFYRGMVPNLLRIAPSTAITFTSYEMLVRWATAWEEARCPDHNGVAPPAAKAVEERLD